MKSSLCPFVFVVSACRVCIHLSFSVTSLGTGCFFCDLPILCLRWASTDNSYSLRLSSPPVTSDVLEMRKWIYNFLICNPSPFAHLTLPQIAYGVLKQLCSVFLWPMDYKPSPSCSNACPLRGVMLSSQSSVISLFPRIRSSPMSWLFVLELQFLAQSFQWISANSHAIPWISRWLRQQALQRETRLNSEKWQLHPSICLKIMTGLGVQQPEWLGFSPHHRLKTPCTGFGHSQTKIIALWQFEKSTWWIERSCFPQWVLHWLFVGMTF